MITGPATAAALHAERAFEFLRVHEIEATSHVVESKLPIAELILKKARALDAGLLVMGAYGQPVLREVFLGSVTRVGVLLSGDIAVRIDKASSEAAALALGTSVSVTLPPEPVLVAPRRAAASRRGLRSDRRRRHDDAPSRPARVRG